MESANQIILFDFNRTLYDPDRRALMAGAVELLRLAQSKDYRLVLVGQAAPSRAQLIEELGLGSYFAEVILVEHKTGQLFEAVAARHHAAKAASYVIGDRAQREIEIGYKTGWRTIWLRAGKFADELPAANYPPTHVVTSLDQIPSLL